MRMSSKVLNKKKIEIPMVGVHIEPPYVKNETDSKEKEVQEQAWDDSMNYAYQLDWANKVQEVRQRKTTFRVEYEAGTYIHILPIQR